MCQVTLFSLRRKSKKIVFDAFFALYPKCDAKPKHTVNIANNTAGSEGGEGDSFLPQKRSRVSVDGVCEKKSNIKHV